KGVSDSVFKMQINPVRCSNSISHTLEVDFAMHTSFTSSEFSYYFLRAWILTKLRQVRMTSKFVHYLRTRPAQNFNGSIRFPQRDIAQDSLSEHHAVSGRQSNRLPNFLLCPSAVSQSCGEIRHVSACETDFRILIQFR